MHKIFYLNSKGKQKQNKTNKILAIFQNTRLYLCINVCSLSVVFFLIILRFNDFNNHNNELNKINYIIFFF